MGTLDELREAYQQATEAWLSTIRAEQALATPDHSMRAWERWDAAHFQEEDARSKYLKALEAYKDGLRHADIGI